MFPAPDIVQYKQTQPSNEGLIFLSRNKNFDTLFHFMQIAQQISDIFIEPIPVLIACLPLYSYIANEW
jgi:hypothetical protein